METTRDTALRLASEVDQWLKAGNSVGNLSEHAVAGLADTFERAILAERERSAQAARDYLAAEFMPAFGSLPDDLAAAILAAPPVGGR